MIGEENGDLCYVTGLGRLGVQSDYCMRPDRATDRQTHMHT